MLAKNLIEKLIEFKVANEYKDSKMARLTGVSRQRWEQIEDNPKDIDRIGIKFIRGVSRNLKSFKGYVTKEDIDNFILGGSNGNHFSGLNEKMRNINEGGEAGKAQLINVSNKQ